jgi:hypothetical protein
MDSRRSCLSIARRTVAVENKESQPPVLPSGPASSTEAAAAGLVTNQAALIASRAAGQQLPGTVTSITSQQLQACSRCTCD